MTLIYREAQQQDLSSLIHMLADDELGQTREDNSFPTNQNYIDAFKSISRDPNNELIVVVEENHIVGMLQLTFIPYLSHVGSWRCLIESVRIHSAYRGKGLGTKFFQWAIARAKEKNCHMVQLTSDKQRVNALRFYENMGFKATHEGFKLKLESER